MILRISVVPGNVPLLLSHEVMVLLDLSYHSRSKTVHVGELGTMVKAVCPTGGHPMIDLLDFPNEGLQGKFDMSEGLLEVRLDETSSQGDDVTKSNNGDFNPAVVVNNVNDGDDDGSDGASPRVGDDGAPEP